MGHRRNEKPTAIRLTADTTWTTPTVGAGHRTEGSSHAPETTVSRGGKMSQDNLIRNLPPRRANLPEYIGAPHEDPHTFLELCQERLAQCHNHQSELAERASEQMRGDARAWWSMWPADALIDTGASAVFVRPDLVPPGALHPDDGELRLATTAHAGRMQGRADVEIDDMLQSGVIEPSHSRYNACIVLASKKDGTSRFCVDFRPLNAVTVSTPPPQISFEAAVASLGRARVFSTLDLKSGYWQVPIRCRDRKKTAFTSMMTRVLEGYIGRFTLAYLDNIIVYSESWEDHCRHLALVMERFATNHLTANPAKCHLGTTEVEFLGHVVNAEGNRPQIGHLRQIAMAEVPRTRKQLQRFVGLINWLRSYIPNFSQTIVPLTDLLSPQIRYRWGEPAQAAFKTIQEAFTQCHTLARIDLDRPLVLQTDASALGTGAVLYQVDGAGDRQVVDYASAKFGRAERRYHKNQLPDLLSRDPDGGQEVLDDDEWDDILPPARASSTGAAEHACAHITVNGEGAEAPPNTEADVERRVLTAQHRSPNADRRRERASDDGHPTWQIQDGRVMNRPPGVTEAWRTYVFPEVRETVLVFYHDHDLAGYPGTDQTSQAIGQYYHWPGMSRDVRDYVRECETCQ
ncbi:uncharacterized protein LOC134537331 [Bacillus rossius redtenbacheri]|uniref:uncharacterized protein LOC134537331 n=1 Tax=Bacillus rossius redtenbacheri TaxID=93214 RepID=UPI002FDD79C2